MNINFLPSPVIIHLVSRGVEIAALILFVIALVLAFKNIRSEEEFEPRETLKETSVAIIAFFFFLFMSGQSLPLLVGLGTIGCGLVIGMIVSFFIHLYQHKSHWFTRGSLVFMILWALVLLGTKVSERVMGDFEYWWLVMGLFTITMSVGNVLTLLFRKTRYRQTG